MGRPKLDPADREVIPRSRDKLNPTGRKVLSLHLRGLRTREIATALGLCEQHVAKVMRERRYLEALDGKLDLIDDEFLRLRPDALRALANALRSEDQAIGLRASEVWFKLVGQGGYGNGDGAGAKVTAEDLAQALLAAGGGTVTITAEPAREQSEEAAVVLLEPRRETRPLGRSLSPP